MELRGGGRASAAGRERVEIVVESIVVVENRVECGFVLDDDQLIVVETIAGSNTRDLGDKLPPFDFFLGTSEMERKEKTRLERMEKKQQKTRWSTDRF